MPLERTIEIEQYSDGSVGIREKKVHEVGRTLHMLDGVGYEGTQDRIKGLEEKLKASEAMASGLRQDRDNWKRDATGAGEDRDWWKQEAQRLEGVVANQAKLIEKSDQEKKRLLAKAQDAEKDRAIWESLYDSASLSRKHTEEELEALKKMNINPSSDEGKLT